MHYIILTDTPKRGRIGQPIDLWTRGRTTGMQRNPNADNYLIYRTENNVMAERPWQYFIVGLCFRSDDISICYKKKTCRTIKINMENSQILQPR